MKVKAKFKCPSCEKFFAEGFEFTPMYHCDNDSEFWEKSDGRNCPTCNKFGANTEGDVCPDCNGEIEGVDVEVDPDECEIMDTSGSEIVTPKRAKKNKIDEKVSAAKALESKKRRDEADASFKRDVKPYRIETEVRLSFSDSIVAIKKVKVIDSNICIYASVGVSPNYTCDGEGERYEVEFRINSDGFETRYNHMGGFCYPVGKSAKFDDMATLVAFAKQKINSIKEMK
jgi:hypothetical protein